jgi:thioredoxin
MTEADLFSRLRQTAGPVIVEVWAPWCGPCRAMAPALQHLEAAYQSRVTLWRVYADEQPAVVQALGVNGIPTLVAFTGGQEQWRRTGAQSTGALASLFAALETEQAPPPALTTTDRVLRAGAGAALLLLAGLTGRFPLLLAAVAGVLIFSAFYDRCPLWRALTARLRRRAV